MGIKKTLLRVLLAVSSFCVSIFSQQKNGKGDLGNSSSSKGDNNNNKMKMNEKERGPATSACGHQLAFKQPCVYKCVSTGGLGPSLFFSLPIFILFFFFSPPNLRPPFPTPNSFHFANNKERDFLFHVKRSTFVIKYIKK